MQKKSSSKAGRFIVIEGFGAAGKTTQLEELTRYYQEKGQVVTNYHFPVYTADVTGPMITTYLTGGFGEASSIAPELASLQYAINRWQFADAIRDDLRQGKTVVCSRYVSSNLAYQMSGLPKEKWEEFITLILDLEYGIFGLNKEDVVLVLYSASEVAFQKLAAKRQAAGGEGHDGLENHVDKIRRIQAAYKYLCDRFDHWHMLDVANPKKEGELLPIADITQKIIHTLDS